MSLTQDEISGLEGRARAIRKRIVQVAYSAGGGHVGGSLSQTDVVTALYFKYLDIDPANPEKPDRDRFILSKGHAGLGWASALGEAGYFDTALLDDFNKTGAAFGMHLDSLKVPGNGLDGAYKVFAENKETVSAMADGDLTLEGSPEYGGVLGSFMVRISDLLLS